MFSQTQSNRIHLSHFSKEFSFIRFSVSWLKKEDIFFLAEREEKSEAIIIFFFYGWKNAEYKSSNNQYYLQPFFPIIVLPLMFLQKKFDTWKNIFAGYILPLTVPVCYKNGKWQTSLILFSSFLKSNPFSLVEGGRFNCSSKFLMSLFSSSERDTVLNLKRIWWLTLQNPWRFSTLSMSRFSKFWAKTHHKITIKSHAEQ